MFVALMILGLACSMLARYRLADSPGEEWSVGLTSSYLNRLIG